MDIDDPFWFLITGTDDGGTCAVAVIPIVMSVMDSCHRADKVGHRGPNRDERDGSDRIVDLCHAAKHLAGSDDACCENKEETYANNGAWPAAPILVGWNEDSV